MKKSNEYKKAINNLTVYYYNELLKENDKDPIQTITTNFVNNIELTKKQRQFVENEIENMDFNMVDYINNMITLLKIYEKDLSKISKEDVSNIIKGFEVIKKNIIIQKEV